MSASISQDGMLGEGGCGFENNSFIYESSLKQMLVVILGNADTY